MSYDPMTEDAVVACADLVGRAGANRFEIGYLHDDVPSEDAGWYAIAFYRGTRMSVDDQPSPAAAADGLACLLLNGTCRCGRPAVLDPESAGCLWRRVGKRWEPGCDAAPIEMAAGERGDGVALNRAMRRRLARGRGA
jgi:hypothetical protein